MNKTIWFSPDKRSLDNIDIKRIFLDYKNPRITWEKFESEKDLLLYMYNHYSLDELAISMTQFWYFDAEPVVCIPLELPKEFEKLSKIELSESTKYDNFLKTAYFTVVEWNRRVSTLKILLNISWYNDLNIRKDIFKKVLTSDIISDLSSIPIIVYPRRKDITPYLWVRHIWWNKPWEPYAQALYIDDLINNQWYSFESVKDLMSDKSWKIIKNYISLKLFDTAEENNINIVNARNSFSFLTLSIWQKSVKEYLGFPTNLNQLEGQDKIIIEDKIDNFKRYFKWIYWDKKAWILPIIFESRDITKKLTKILANEKSLTFLEKTNDIDWAFDRSDWEKDMILTWLSTSHRKISNLKDDLDLLLSKWIIKVFDVEDDIFLLEKNVRDLKEILNKYNK